MKKVVLLIAFIIIFASFTSSTLSKTQNQLNIEEGLINDKENIPGFIITGFAVYTENKNIIIPVYYSLITFLLIIVIFNLLFKKTKSENLIEEANDLLKDEELKKSKINFVNKKGELELAKDGMVITEEREREYIEEMESIPEMEPYSDGKEIKEKIKKEETEVDEKEVFKESEEVLESEVKKEIKEEKRSPEKKPIRGQPAPLNSDTGKPEDTEELINEAEKLEKNK